MLSEGRSRTHTEVRVVVVLVKGAPKEGTDNAGALDGAEGEVHRPDHLLIGRMGQGDVVGGEGLAVLCILLQTMRAGPSVSYLSKAEICPKSRSDLINHPN